jgi:hypothetical protein
MATPNHPTMLLRLLFLTAALLLNTIQSWQSQGNSYLTLKQHSTKFQRVPSISMTSSEEPNVGAATSRDASSRPPIIPFDFARDDIIPPKVIDRKVDYKEEAITKNENSGDFDSNVDDESARTQGVGSDRWNPSPKKKESLSSTSSNKWVEDPSRPTGYGNVDEDDNDWVPSSDSEGVEKFLKDYFFNSPYDSSKRRDAKFVIRNVTLISGILGTIFTILFYAFPGKFISYRGTANFSQRYSTEITDKDPSELLNDKVNNDLTRSVEIGQETFYDDGIGMPGPDDSRVAYPKKDSDRYAPGRTENL